ncbi:hypothetical protein CsatB_004703 [Cannabis sativa]
MASMQCYKPTNETCQQKCLDNCYGHNKHNDSTESYYSGHSMTGHGQGHNASHGQGYYPGSHTMNKPNTYSTYGQGYGHQQGHHMMTEQYGHSMTKPAPGQSYGMGPTMSHGMGSTLSHGIDMMTTHAAHGNTGHAHGSTGHAHGQSHQGYSEHQSYGSHGMMMGANGCKGKKKDRSHKMMMKRRDCNRGGDSSDSGSDSDCN